MTTYLDDAPYRITDEMASNGEQQTPILNIRRIQLMEIKPTSTQWWWVIPPLVGLISTALTHKTILATTIWAGFFVVIFAFAMYLHIPTYEIEFTLFDGKKRTYLSTRDLKEAQYMMEILRKVLEKANAGRK